MQRIVVCLLEGNCWRRNEMDGKLSKKGRDLKAKRIGKAEKTLKYFQLLAGNKRISSTKKLYEFCEHWKEIMEKVVQAGKIIVMDIYKT